MSHVSRPDAAAGPGGPALSRAEKLIEIVAVLLLGLTTVGTAWCGYQATVWSGASSEYARIASDEQVEAARLFGLATQTIAYDSVITAQYAAAVAGGDTELELFYRSSLVRKDFRPTLDTWVADIRAGRQPTPLADDQGYLDAQLTGYRDASAAAQENNRLGAEAGGNAAAYVSVTILLAAALFFSGVISTFRYRSARALLLAAALATLAVAGARLAGLPVSF